MIDKLHLTLDIVLDALGLFQRVIFVMYGISRLVFHGLVFPGIHHFKGKTYLNSTTVLFHTVVVANPHLFLAV